MSRGSALAPSGWFRPKSVHWTSISRECVLRSSTKEVMRLRESSCRRGTFRHTSSGSGDTRASSSGSSPTDLAPEFGFYPIDPGADRLEGVGTGAQLGRGVGLLVEAGELLCGFFGAAAHHLGKHDLVDEACGQCGFTEERLGEPGGLL